MGHQCITRSTCCACFKHDGKAMKEAAQQGKILAADIHVGSWNVSPVISAVLADRLAQAPIWASTRTQGDQMLTNVPAAPDEA